MRHKTILSMILILLFAIVSMSYAEASMIGVNRANLHFTDVLRNGYAEETFVVSIGTEQDVEVFFEARGEIAQWLSFEPGEGRVLVNQDTPRTIRVIAQPPTDARAEGYEGTILVLTGPVGEASGRMGTNVVAAFEIRVRLDITDTQILRCNVGGMSIRDAEVGFPLEFSATTSNRGNVRIRPQFQIDVYDQSEQNTVFSGEYVHGSDVLPTLSAQISGGLNWDLNPGQYWARISEPTCQGSSYVTFSVLERGAISDVGEFIRIKNDAWAEVGEIVPIEIHFRNRGERTVNAQFKGTVSRAGSIVEVLESSTVTVSPNELVELEMFFTPSEQGQYEIKGRVHYNQKLTFERGSMLNVQPSSASARVRGAMDSVTLILITTVVFIFIISFMILKKEKQKRRRI